MRTLALIVCLTVSCARASPALEGTTDPAYTGNVLERRMFSQSRLLRSDVSPNSPFRVPKQSFHAQLPLQGSQSVPRRGQAVIAKSDRSIGEPSVSRSDKAKYGMLDKPLAVGKSSPLLDSRKTYCVSQPRSAQSLN